MEAGEGKLAAAIARVEGLLVGGGGEGEGEGSWRAALAQLHLVSLSLFFF